MKPNRPLSYLATKCVLQYMEANQRIEFIRRCPSLETVDKAVPLSIDTLMLFDRIVVINNHDYSLGVIRQYPKGFPKIFKHHKKINKKGGSILDLDEFGHWDRASFGPHFPGDIELESILEHNIENLTLEEESRQFELWKNQVNYLRTLKKTKERLEEIDETESYLHSWLLKSLNIRAPFKMYLQYTHNKEDGTKKIEYLEYNKKMYEAMKYLNHYLFSGRKHPLRVCCFGIPVHGGVLRLPESLRISTREVITGSNVGSIMKSLEPILVHQKFKVFTVMYGRSLALNYDHPAIVSAEELLIGDIPVTGDNFHIVLNDRHKCLCILHPKLVKEEYIRLINKIKEDRREIGTQYSFGVDSKALITELFEDIKSQVRITWSKRKEQKCSTFPYIYSLPIDDTSRMTIYCWQNKVCKKSEPWILYISVEANVEYVIEESRKCVIS